MKILLKKILTSLLILVGLITCTFAYLYSTKLTVSNAKNIAVSELRGKFTQFGNFTDTTKFDSREPEIVLTKDDFNKPAYSLIINDGLYSSPEQSKSESKSFSVFVFYFKRESLWNQKYSITSYTSNSVRGLHISDLSATAAKYDLSVTNPPGDFVRVNRGTPLTPTEITSASRASTIISILNQKQEVSTTLDYQTNCIYQKIGKPLTKIPVPLSVSPFGFFYQSSEHYILTKADYDQYDQPCLDEMRQVFADTLGSDLASDPSVAGYLISPFQLPAPCVGFGCASSISP